MALQDSDDDFTELFAKQLSAQKQDKRQALRDQLASALHLCRQEFPVWLAQRRKAAGGKLKQ